MKFFVATIILTCITLNAYTKGNPVFSTQRTSTCQGDSVFLGGKHQKTGGVYIDSLKSSSGCDSIVVTTLTVNPTYFTKTKATVCGYDSILISARYIKTAGTYIDSLQTVLGCDSIIEITVADSRFNATAGRRGTFWLEALFTGDKYQWLDCRNNYLPVAGANTQVVFLPDGRYAVEITYNGCIDTSECVSINVGLNEIQFANSINIYPNPASNAITISLDKEYRCVSVEIVSVTGQLLKTETFSNKKECALNTQQIPTGVYLLKIIADGEQATKRIVIQ